MKPTSPETRETQAAAREERARDAALAMEEYEAKKLATVDKTSRLRALRLAKKACDAIQPGARKPKKKVD